MKIKSNNFIYKRKILFLFLSTLLLFGCSNQTSAQTFDWVKSIDLINPGDLDAKDITVDAFGNIYTIGDYFGVVDFDPGPGVYSFPYNFDYSLYITKLDSSGNFIWAKTLDGYWVFGVSIVTDPTGNIYFSGHRTLLYDFDPGPGVVNVPNIGNNDNFVSKWDSSGNFQWVRLIGGYPAFGATTSMELDDSGNVYTTGWFTGTYDFDGSANNYFLTTPPATNETFIQKLDNSGNFVWAKSIGTLDSLIISKSSSTIDASGNLYTAGTFDGTADFDPNTGIYNLTATGSYDVFITKMTSFGSLIWAKNIGGISGIDGYQIDGDSIGNIYVTGFFQGTIDFDPDTGVFNLTSSGNSDIFILKLDSSGGFLWAKNIGGIDHDEARSIAIDASGNICMAGFFNGTVDFDPNTSVYNLSSTYTTYPDVFIYKLDSSGNFVSVRSLSSIYTSRDLLINVDVSSNIYVNGVFYMHVDFDPDTGVFILPGTGNSDVFLLKLSQSTIACSVTANVTNILCNGSCDGSIVAVANGVAPFNYLWSTGSGGASIDSLCAGTYSVIMTDSVGCSDTATVLITQPPPIVSTIVSDYSNCNCTFQISASGGTPGYSFSWCDGNTATQIINCNPGICTVIVTDANGCIIQDTVFINPPPALSASASSTAVTCFSCADGTITGIVTGGVGPYAYTLQPSGQTNSTGIFTGLSAGNFQLCVTDANNCTSCIAVAIIQPASFCSVTINSVNSILCYGDCTGSLTAVANGVSPFQYLWSTGDSTSTISSLCAGIYSVIMTDSVGCMDSITVSVTEPPALIATTQTIGTTCIGCTDGVAIIIPSGGTPPYTFSLVPSSCSNDTCAGLSAGIYTFNVTDSNGCTTSISDTVLDNPTAVILTEENQFAKIYPNPFTDETTLEINTELLSFQPEFILADVLGNRVSSFVIEKQKTILGRKNHSAGIYFYQINSDSKNLVKGKLVVVD